MEIPIANVYYLLCYAWDKLEEDQLMNVDPTHSTTLVDLFARVLNSGIDHLLKKGFDRGYVVYSEESSCLRGKIQFQTTLKRNLLSRAQVHCEFDELSFNVLHNRIVKSTLARLTKANDLTPETRGLLREHWHRLPEVSEHELSKRLFGQVQLYRNNYVYDFLLRVCELLFDNLLPTEKTGHWRFRSFLQDHDQMAGLFEAFVRNFFRREAHRVFGPNKAKVGREDIRWKLSADTLEMEKLLPKMQTDVCITTEERKILIECKYADDPLAAERFVGGTQKLRAQHLYQINAYLDNLPESSVNRTCQAILLYPTAKRSIESDYKRTRGQVVSIRTINLMQDWSKIHNDLLALVSG